MSEALKYSYEGFNLKIGVTIKTASYSSFLFALPGEYVQDEEINEDSSEDAKETIHIIENTDWNIDTSGFHHSGRWGIFNNNWNQVKNFDVADFSFIYNYTVYFCSYFLSF